MDDLGTPVALGLRLPADGPNHLFRKIYLLHLNHGHLHAPGSGMRIQHRLETEIQLFALAEQFIQLYLTEGATQRGLRHLRCGVEKIRNLENSLGGIQDREIDHRVHLHRHVVARDNVLRGYFHGLDTERNAHDAIDGSEDQDDTWALGLLQHAAQTENHPAFILGQNLDGRKQIDHHDQDGNYQSEIRHRGFSEAISLYTWSRYSAI